MLPSFLAFSSIWPASGGARFFGLAWYSFGNVFLSQLPPMPSAAAAPPPSCASLSRCAVNSARRPYCGVVDLERRPVPSLSLMSPAPPARMRVNKVSADVPTPTMAAGYCCEGARTAAEIEARNLVLLLVRNFAAVAGHGGWGRRVRHTNTPTPGAARCLACGRAVRQTSMTARSATRQTQTLQASAGLTRLIHVPRSFLLPRQLVPAAIPLAVPAAAPTRSFAAATDAPKARNGVLLLLRDAVGHPPLLWPRWQLLVLMLVLRTRGRVACTMADGQQRGVGCRTS